jgi:hypothetical protein
MRKESAMACVLKSSLWVLLLLGLAARAEEPIATDRPDFVESSDVVGPGRFQIETSLAWERDHSQGVRSRLQSTPTLLRYGVSETLELRLETDGRLRARASGGGSTVRQSGSADTAIGLKWHQRDGDEASGRPGIAWLLHLDLDTGSAAFRGQGTRPSLRMVAEWELAGGWSAGVMPGLYRDKNEQGRRYTGAILAAVLGKSLTEELRAFAEVAGQQLTSRRNGGKLVTLDLGLAYLLSPNWQLDTALSRGLTRESPDYSATVGLSAKF